IVLWRGAVEPRAAVVRCGVDGGRAGRPYRVDVSRLPRASGNRALGGRRAASTCRAPGAAGDADPAGARLLPRNAVRGRWVRQARDLDARARWREPAGCPRNLDRRDHMARGRGSAPGDYSLLMILRTSSERLSV